MSKTKIYLAGSCLHEPDEGAEWRTKITEMLEQAANWVGKNVEVVNPLTYFSYAENKHKSHKQVKNFYMNKIRHCNVVIANLENSDSSCGTCMECQFAEDMHIPVIGFNRDHAYPWLAEVTCEVVFDSMAEAVDYIRDYYL